jgi:hypothetical protein
MGLFDNFRSSKNPSRNEQAEVEKFLEGDTRKPTEDNLAALDEFLESYLKMLDVQEYLLIRTDGFLEMDMTPLRMELKRNVSKAKEGGTKQFQIIADDIVNAKKELDITVGKIIEIYNNQNKEPFHISQMK